MKNCNRDWDESKIEDLAILKDKAASLNPVLLPALLLLFEDLRHPVQDSPLPTRGNRRYSSRSPTLNLIVLPPAAILVRYLLLAPSLPLLGDIGIPDEETPKVIDHIVIHLIDILRLYLQLHLLRLPRPRLGVQAFLRTS